MHFCRDTTLPKVVTDLILRRLNDAVSTAEPALHLQLFGSFATITMKDVILNMQNTEHICLNADTSNVVKHWLCSNNGSLNCRINKSNTKGTHSITHAHLLQYHVPYLATEV